MTEESGDHPIVEFFRKHPDVYAAAVEGMREDRRRRTRSGRLNTVGIRELSELVIHPSGPIDGYAAWELAEDGADAAVPAIVVALKSRNRAARDQAIRGLRKALKEKRLTRRFRQAMVEPLRLLLQRIPKLDSGDAAECLLELDRVVAIDLLTSPRSLSPKNPSLVHLLEALIRYRVIVPVERIVPLLRASRPRLSTYPNSCIFGRSLVLLALADPTLGRKWIARALALRQNRSGTYDTVENYAARALLVGRGITDLREQLLAKVSSRGIGGVSRIERHIYCSLLYHYDTENGGLGQFLWNMTSDEIRATPAALCAIGAAHQAVLLTDALSLGGRRRLLTSQQARRDWLSGEGGQRLDRWLDEQSTPCENVETRAMRYAAHHLPDGWPTAFPG